MSPSLEEIKAEFVRIYEDLVRTKGLPPIYGRIMATFLLEGPELSHKEISNLTGYSISSVSRTLDQMVRMGIVHKHKHVSLKYFVYHVNIDLRALSINAFKTQIGSYERYLKEIENLTLKASTIKFKRKEQAGINRLQAMLKDFSKTTKHILESIKRVVTELESPQ